MLEQDRPRIYKVSAHDREPLLAYMVDALQSIGCRVIYHSPPNEAPFRLTFETPTGDRMGICAYAFLANTKLTKNRPDDEHRFQIKYGKKKDGEVHTLWQDPYGLYVTLLLGIDLDLGVFVGADPVLHSPTKFFISLEFKEEHAKQIRRNHWHAWERERRSRRVNEGPVEVLVGGTARSFLRYVRFERDALGEDQGHRQLLAERAPVIPARGSQTASAPTPSTDRLHELAQEFEMSEKDVLSLIAGARRLKMAVRGWVAEEHLVRQLRRVRGVEHCERIDDEGGPDVHVQFEGSRILTVECKNVLRKTSPDPLTKEPIPRIDFQRTRASKGDPWSRYYRPDDFDVVAACLHAVTLQWEYRFIEACNLDRLKKQPDRLSNLVKVDDRWSRSVREVLAAAARH